NYNMNISLPIKDLDSVAAVGKDFENVIALWKSFDLTIINGRMNVDLNFKREK
ncbi:12382_t:CDS:1, partial [Ambispora leptoticha]